MLNIFKNNFDSHAQLPMGRVMFMIQRDASAYLMNHRHAKVMGTSSRNILCIIKSLVGLNIIFIKPTKSFSKLATVTVPTIPTSTTTRNPLSCSDREDGSYPIGNSCGPNYFMCFDGILYPQVR